MIDGSQFIDLINFVFNEKSIERHFKSLLLIEFTI